MFKKLFRTCFPSRRKVSESLTSDAETVKTKTAHNDFPLSPYCSSGVLTDEEWGRKDWRDIVKKKNVFENHTIKFPKQKDIATGASGSVAKFKNPNNRLNYAVKSLKRSKKNSELLFSKELSILTHVEHENIVGIESVCVDEHNYHMIMEYCKGGTLLSRIANDGSTKFTPQIIQNITRQLLKAISYLHQYDIVHLDLKPENVGFKDKKRYDLRLLDFGLSKVITNPEIVYKRTAGTVAYLSPERLSPHFAWELKKSDVWSIGVMVFEMFACKRCFLGKSKQQTYINIRHCKLKWPQNIPEDAKSFIQYLLQKSSVKRPSAKEALQHPWLNSD